VAVGRNGAFGGNGAFVLKLNQDGNVEWQHTFGGNQGDVAYSVQRTRDGGYIVAGREVVDAMKGYTVPWVLKLNQDGTVEWQNTFGENTNNAAYSVQQTRDGGYIVAGGGNGAFVLKLNQDGNVEWQHTFGGTNDEAYSVQQTRDGGYIVAGGDNWPFGGNGAFVLKLNQYGTVEWQNTFGGNTNNVADNVAHSVQQTSDGGYIVAGWEAVDTGNGTTSLPFVLKLGPVGTGGTGIVMGDNRVTPGGRSAVNTNIHAPIDRLFHGRVKHNDTGGMPPAMHR
jgi:hypothetical protein